MEQQNIAKAQLLYGCIDNSQMYYNAVDKNCRSRMNVPFFLRDESRNSAWLSIYTLGASWHNNHHAFPRTASNRLRWWEIDIAGMVIWLLEKLGIVWDVWRPSRELVQIRRTGVGVQADGHDAEAHIDPTPPAG